jgi:hypothetical protein
MTETIWDAGEPNYECFSFKSTPSLIPQAIQTTVVVDAGNDYPAMQTVIPVKSLQEFHVDVNNGTQKYYKFDMNDFQSTQDTVITAIKDHLRDNPDGTITMSLDKIMTCDNTSNLVRQLNAEGYNCKCPMIANGFRIVDCKNRSEFGKQFMIQLYKLF